MVITVMIMKQCDDDNFETREKSIKKRENYSNHRINDDEEIPTMTPIPEENAFASSAPFEAGSPLGLDLLPPPPS